MPAGALVVVSLVLAALAAWRTTQINELLAPLGQITV